MGNCKKVLQAYYKGLYDIEDVKLLQMKNMQRIILIAMCIVALGALAFGVYEFKGEFSQKQKTRVAQVSVQTLVPAVSPQPQVTPTPTLTPTPTPIPLPDPAVYGPCKNIPVLMYHHIQPWTEAESKGQKSLTVKNDVFSAQMDYLVKRGYTAITPKQLHDALTGMNPVKPVLLTFDDGYADFYTYAYPELVKHGFKATMFLSTGLAEGADYLKWSQISEMHGSGLITFANHTWSHKNLGKSSLEMAKFEVDTAKTQLEEHGLGPVTAFAYPYGTEGGSLIYGVLKDAGIKVAFTTIPGSYQCAKLPYDVRRTRVGNSSLSSYGL